MSKRFEFRLQKALEWYRQSLAAQKTTLQRITAELYALDGMIASIESDRIQEQAGFQQGGVFLGRDLAGLTGFLASLRARLIDLKSSRARTTAKLAEQRRLVETLHRKVRVLEELEARRRSDWLHEVSVAEDSDAAELFQAAAVRSREA